MTLQEKIIATSAPASVILIRVAVGAVFLTEGIQKLLFPGENGVGRQFFKGNRSVISMRW